jgi:isoleucyl-tRNA synthetase
MPIVNALPPNYDPKSVETEILKYWEEARIYIKVKERNERNRDKFLFIDGPPYTSSDTPHIGTAWNKVIKDAILRYNRLLEKRVRDQPGYDCHGLPIEVIMERKLGIKRKGDIATQIGVKKFVEGCAEFALNNARSLTSHFMDLGVFMDWENPYYTMDNYYISNAWSLFKKAYERGLLEQGYEVLHWCPRCETTLADYEVSEYRKIEDPSLYVKFKITGQERSLLIWTTTPWTIPANVFIMVNADYDYSDVEVKGETLVIATARVEEVMKEIGVTNYEVKRTYKGKELLGLGYEHPLSNEVPIQREVKHVVIDGANNVSLKEGTGLVHGAPGHGDVDFAIGKTIKAPVLVLVNDQGQFTEEAGIYRGLEVREANSRIIADLRERGALAYSGTVVHSYPVCWRCKTPLILRATTQWFFRVSRLKDLMLREVKKVNWIPEWGETRISNMIKELRDWVVSRQRFWGTPLPIWVCDNCKEITVIGSEGELREKASSEVPSNLHRPWVDSVTLKCNKCGGACRRVQDVADVWFDSGVAFYASLGRNWEEVWKRDGPVDLVVEGHDQLRGWFFSLLRSGVILTNETPYRTVLVHGFMLDENGREMHKSLGNYVEPREVIDRYSRDVLRLWLLRNLTWEDPRFSWNSIELTKRDLQIIWNTFVFASTYMNLDSFDPSSIQTQSLRQHLRAEDKWLLSRYNRMLMTVKDAMRGYRVHEVARAVIDFLVEDVSRFYLRITRKRAWSEVINEDKLAMYYTLYKVLRGWTLVASIVVPFITEKIYLTVFPDHQESTQLDKFPTVEESELDGELELTVDLARKIYTASVNARSRIGLKLRWPVKRAYVFVENDVDVDRLNKIKPMLLTLLNAKEIEVYSSKQYSSFLEVKLTPKLAAIGKTFKSKAKLVINYIERNSANIARDIASNGFHEAELDGAKIRITEEHVGVEESVKSGFVASKYDGGIVVISEQISQEEEEEGIVRDVVRRIQFMRKKLSLNVNDYISVTLKAPEDRARALNRWVDYVKQETRAKSIEIGEVRGELIMDWEIDGEDYSIGVSKVT